MRWQSNLKERYAAKGWEALREADEAFKRRLERFCAEKGILVLDDNPEGKDWMILLKDGTEAYVDRRSYVIADRETEFWTEYNPDFGGVIAEFFDIRGRPSKQEVIIPNSEISAVCDEWQ
jgi:hypothetical protein